MGELGSSMTVWAEKHLLPSITFQKIPLTIKSLNIYLPSCSVENFMFTKSFIESLKTGFLEKWVF
jgi:hypothetical protein